MKKIAILGYKGFVGSAFYDHFSSIDNCEVIGVDRDNYDSHIGQSFDVFINANGNSKKRLAATDPKLDFDMNVKTTVNTVLDFKFDKYVHISSIDVYNDVQNTENNHEDITIDLEKLSNYGFDKYMGELVVKKYTKKWLILRLGGMVGKNLKKNAIYDMVHLKKLFVHEDSEYQYMDTADVAKITEKLLERNNEIFNICGKNTVKLKSISNEFNFALTEMGKEKQKYNISIKKLESAVEEVPDTATTVKNFIKSKL